MRGWPRFWWSGVWDFRKRLGVHQPADGYQMPITVYDEDGHDDPAAGIVDCEGRCNEDFSDLRFVSGDEELPYWIESVEPDGAARVWVRTAGHDEIYVYFGNAGALPASNGESTFLFFDEFSSDSLVPGGSGIWSRRTQASLLRRVGPKHRSSTHFTSG